MEKQQPLPEQPLPAGPPAPYLDPALGIFHLHQSYGRWTQPRPWGPPSGPPQGNV